MCRVGNVGGDGCWTSTQNPPFRAGCYPPSAPRGRVARGTPQPPSHPVEEMQTVWVRNCFSSMLAKTPALQRRVLTFFSPASLPLPGLFSEGLTSSSAPPFPGFPTSPFSSSSCSFWKIGLTSACPSHGSPVPQGRGRVPSQAYRPGAPALGLVPLLIFLCGPR